MTKSFSRAGLLAVVAGLALAACGPEDAAQDPAPAQTPPGGTPSQAPPNSTPTISGSPGTTVAAGTTYLFQVSASDADGDALSFSATGLPSWATLNTQTGMLSGTPTAGNAGTTADIVISVSDGEASAALAAFQITVTSTTPPTTPPASNSPPVISGTPGTTVQATSAYSFTPTASDPNGQSLFFSIANKPGWAAFSSTTGALTGTPTTAQVRTYSNIVITASDGSLSASLPAFSITVSAAANRAPTITGSAPTTAAAGSAYTFTPTGSDPDGQTLTYSVTNKPAWAAFNTSNGRLSGTPTAAGTHSGIVITVSDGALSASLAAFTITVSAAPNAAPVISGTPATSVTAASAYSFTPSASDADGNTLAFSISNKPSWATFSTATGALTGTPTTGQVGAYSNIVISVSDGTTSTALPAFTINVTAGSSSGTAALSWTAPTQNTDGTSLTDLAGYKVYHGLSASALTDVVTVSGASSTSYTFSQLTAGTHYFAVSSYNNAGVESALSAVGSKVVP